MAKLQGSSAVAIFRFLNIEVSKNFLQQTMVSSSIFEYLSESTHNMMTLAMPKIELKPLLSMFVHFIT